MFHYTPPSNHDNLLQMSFVHEGLELLQSGSVLQHVALHAGLLTCDWWVGVVMETQVSHLCCIEGAVC